MVRTVAGDQALTTDCCLPRPRPAGDGTGLKSNANTHVIERVCGTASTPEMRRVEAASLPELPVLHLKDCSYAQFAVPRDAALVKVLVEGCSDVTLQLEGCAVRTETLELWKCERVAVRVVGTSGTEQAEGRSGAEGGAEGGAAGTRLATVQLDLSTGVELEFERAESVGQVVQAGVRALRGASAISVLQAPPNATPTAAADLASARALSLLRRPAWRADDRGLR